MAAGAGAPVRSRGRRVERSHEAHEAREEYASLAPGGHDEAPLASDYQDGHHDDRIYDPQQYGDRLQASDGSDPYYQDDIPLEPHDDEMYDDAPHARRGGGFVTALVIIGCAVLGTAGAYAYRSHFGSPSSTEPPPVITADNSSPTKIIPATAGDPQSSKSVQDRLATGEKEQLVSKQEEPVTLKDLRRASRRPAPRAPGSAGPGRLRGAVVRRGQWFERAEEGPHRHHPPGRNGRERQARGSAAPGGPDTWHAGTTASPRTATTPPAPRTAPQAGEAAAPARSRIAALPPSAEGAANGFVVQLSSQKTESEAQSSFRSLQAKFPNELGNRQPIIRKADLGSKGVFYRTMVGPFASAHEASQFCASYKAAGGQCVVPNN